MEMAMVAMALTVPHGMARDGMQSMARMAGGGTMLAMVHFTEHLHDTTVQLRQEIGHIGGNQIDHMLLERLYCGQIFGRPYSALGPVGVTPA